MPDTASGTSQAADAQALWRSLTTAANEAEFGEAWLGLVIQAFGGARSAVLLIPCADGRRPVMCRWPADRQPDSALVTAMREAMRAGQGAIQPAADPSTPTRLAYPIRLGDSATAVCAFEIGGEADPRAVMRQIRWAAAWPREWWTRHAVVQTMRAADRVGIAIDMMARALHATHFRAACRIAADELAARFDCARVSIGFMRRRTCRVIAQSREAAAAPDAAVPDVALPDAAGPDAAVPDVAAPDAAAVRLCVAAMREAIDQRGPVLWPEPSPEAALTTRAHQAVAEAGGGTHVLTVPLLVRDRFLGAITCERDAATPFDQATIELIESIASILGPALIDKRDRDRGLTATALASLARQGHRLVGPGYWGRKLLVVAAVLAVMFGVLAQGAYRITAEARVEGQVQRAMAAPYDGYIADASVQAGETVQAGQVLATMDDRDLVLERMRWVTERQQHLAEYDQALSQGKRGDAARFRAQLDDADAQIRLLDEQLARTRIVAPFTGLVVSGDLSQSIGAPVRRGDTLFEIAPLDSYRVLLRVPDAQIAEVSAGQGGALLVSALPDVELPFTIRRIVPVPEARDGRLTFEVDATIDGTEARLRPGMEGYGKIDVGTARLVWVWFRGLLHWLRLELWAWFA